MPKRSVFIDDNAVDSDDEREGRNPEEDDDDDDEADVEGLIADVDRKDKDGHHLAVGASMREELLDKEQAELEAAAERYAHLGATYMQSDGAGRSAGPPVSLLDADSELGEMARAARARAEKEAREAEAAARAAAIAKAEEERKAKAKLQKTLASLYDDDDGDTPPPATAATSKPPEPPRPAAGAEAQASAPAGKYRIKKKARTA